MYLTNPALYLPVATFKAQPNDYSLAPYTDSQLQDLLVRASGKVDSILRRSYLPQEITDRFYGDGSNVLMMNYGPVIYIKSIEYVLPGMTGFQVPISQILVNYRSSELLEYTPLIFQGMGQTSVFPRGAPVDICFAYGAAIPISAPAFSTADVQPTVTPALTPGAYTVGITTKTMWGESIATLHNVTTTTGAIQCTITPVAGAYLYQVYIKSGSSQPAGSLTLVGQSPSTTYANAPLTVVVQSASTPTYLFPASDPVTDTTASQFEAAIIEATRIIALGILWEQNNLANRGIRQQKSGQKTMGWMPTEGNAGRGTPMWETQARELLSPYSLQQIF